MEIAKIESLFSLLEQQEDLTAYETDVLQSMKAYYNKSNRLTERQYLFLEKIVSNYTPEAIEAKKKWAETFREKREDFLIVARYYQAQGQYFRDLARKALRDEEFVPSEKAFNKMCNNNYAKKVLEQHYAEPKYSVGDMVYPTTKAPSEDYRKISRGGIIMQANGGPIISACKGAKRYLVLPVGDSHGILIEERHLKRRK